MLNQYDTDFNLWTQETVKLLEEQQWHQVDWLNLIEEIKDLGKSERRAISSQLERILIHLLKWQYQPQKRSDSWLDSISDARIQIRKILQDNPSLKTFPETCLRDDYADARRYAAKQTGLDLELFPIDCPYDLAQILNEDWLPNQE